MAVSEPRVAILGGSGRPGDRCPHLDAHEQRKPGGGAFPDFCELERVFAGTEPELQAVIVDGDDPNAGPAAVSRLRHAYPQLRIVLLCEFASPALVSCAIDNHLEGLVLQTDAVEDVVLALHHVLEGRAVMPVGWHAASDAAATARWRC